MVKDAASLPPLSSTNLHNAIMWLHLWFGLSQRVDRRTYLLTGCELMFLKYVVDSTVVWSYTGRWWKPFDYVSPLWSVRAGALQGVPPSVMLGLALWTLPFLWIGVSMSLRRAVDAGRS